MKPIDPTLSNVENARIHGVSEATIRRWKAKAALEDFDEFFKEVGVDPEKVQVTSAGVSLRDPETGSWRKVTWKPPAPEPEDDYERIDASALLNSLDHPVPNPLRSAGDGVFGISINDTQFGKKEGGGTEGTVRRVRASVSAAKARLVELRQIGRKLGTGLIVGGGDIIEGCTIYPNQSYSIDQNRHEQIETAVTTLLWVIDKMASEFDLSLIHI